MLAAWIATAVAWMILISSVWYLLSYRKTIPAENVWRILALMCVTLMLGPVLTLKLLYLTLILIQP